MRLLWSIPLWVVSLFLIGCQWNSSSSPSVLVIGVESLGFQSVICRDDEATETISGFHAFCKEGLRFTHAYAPSTQTVSALASVLTGEYPFAHGVRHNGYQFLSGSIQTAAELALQKRYSTGFFSGGPPVFFKSGLGQGFQVFDDVFSVQHGEIFRRARETLNVYTKWLTDQANNPSFSVIFLPDLQFRESTSAHDSSVSPQTHLDEIDQALGELVKNLKQQKRWDKTHIFLFGTSGGGRELPSNEIQGTALTSNQTQVSLFIKPATPPRDLGMTWTSDQNVTLVDVGQTIFELFGAEKRERAHYQISLLPLFLGQDQKNEDERPIFLETAWPLWRGVGLIRAAVRIGEYVFLNDTTPRLFNTLIDRFEVNPINEMSDRPRKIFEKAKELLSILQIPPWERPNDQYLAKIQTAEEIWNFERSPHEVRALLERRMRSTEKDPHLVHWLAEFYAQNEQWPELLKFSQKNGLQLWAYVADHNLTRKLPMPRDPCVTLILSSLKTKVLEPLKEACDDEQSQLFVQWVSSSEDGSRERARERLIRSMRAAWLDRRFTRQNYASGLMWDTRFWLNSQASRLEVLLHLPTFRKLKLNLKRRIEIVGTTKE